MRWLLTEGDLDEEVVCNVIMRDIVEEEATSPAEKRTVNSGSSTAEERPLLGTVVRDLL